MDIKSLDSGVRSYVKQQYSRPVSEGIPGDYLRPVRREDLDAETLATLTKFEEQLRVDPDWDGSTWSRREFSDSAIKDAIGKADMTKMNDDQIEAQIEVFNFVMQSGREQDFSIVGKNGDQTTTSMSQYLTWLTDRREEMKGDGTYSPAIASTW